MAPKLIRAACGVCFVAGIAGMIVTSVNGNNEGYVVTIGMVTAVAALVLVVTSALTASRRIDVFVEADAERLERRVDALVAAGADEHSVRELVRDAVHLGRGA
ncbi:MAG: hypothetical protein WAS51_03325 [Ilumatobacteraceae bacterium]|nr:MAG: hypothetical protein IPM43_13440 [Actinomycetota bacterium]